MQVTDIPLLRDGDSESMAQELEISEARWRSGAAARAPAIRGGFKKQAQGQPGGLEGRSAEQPALSRRRLAR